MSTANAAHTFNITDCKVSVKCANCDEMSVAETDHSFTITDCKVSVKCANCDAMSTANAAHFFPAWEAIPHNCATAGANVTVTRDCTVCGFTDTETKTTNADGHIPGTRTLCTEAIACIICGAETTPPGSHDAGARAGGLCTNPLLCTACGFQLDAGIPHVDADSDGLCDVCGFDMSVPGCPCSHLHNHKLGLPHGKIIAHDDSPLGRIVCFLCRIWHWIPFLFFFGWLWMY